MAAESNTGFCHEGSFGSSMSQNAISFQSGAINSSSGDMIQMANYYGVNNNNTNMLFSGNSSLMSSNLVIPQAGGSLLVESVPGLKQETGLAVEWSVEEQAKLDEGLKKYEDEQNILKYIKIAAMLGDKTVRDVALRCKWMTRKRRKQEDHNFLKKGNRKDKLVESSSKTNISLTSPLNLAPYSLFTNHLDHNERMHVEALSGPTRLMLEQNNQVLKQISVNLSLFKLQENIDLFLCTRNNLAAVLNDMRDMPGIMSRMPPLPVSLNDGLVNSLLLPTSSQAMLFGSSSGIHLKQEPGC